MFTAVSKLSLFLAMGIVAVHAQGPSLNSDNGNLATTLPPNKDFVANRCAEEQTSIFELRKQVNDLSARLSAVQPILDTLGLVATSIGRIDSVVADIAKARAELDTQKIEVRDQLADNKKSMDLQLASEKSRMDALAAAIRKDASDDRSSMRTEMNALSQSNAVAISKMQSDSAALRTSITNTVDTKIKALEESNDVSVWVGGSRRSTRRGTHHFNLDRVDLDSSGPYFKVSGNYMTALREGVFNIHWRILAHGGWCHNHMRFYIDGKQVNGDTHHYISGTWWQQNTEETLTLKAGQRLHMTISGGCHYTLHGSNQNQPYVHNRVTFRYLGKTATTCKGPFCKSFKP